MQYIFNAYATYYWSGHKPPIETSGRHNLTLIYLKSWLCSLKHFSASRRNFFQGRDMAPRNKELALFVVFRIAERFCFWFLVFPSRETAILLGRRRTPSSKTKTIPFSTPNYDTEKCIMQIPSNAQLRKAKQRECVSWWFYWREEKRRKIVIYGAWRSPA